MAVSRSSGETIVTPTFGTRSVFLILGLFGMIPLLFADVTIGSVTFGIHSLLYFAAFVIVGITVISFGLLTRIYVIDSGFMPETKMPRLVEKVRMELVLLFGVLLVVAGIALSIYAFAAWGGASFGDLRPEAMMRVIIPAVTLIIVGAQMSFTSFFAGIITIPSR